MAGWYLVRRTGRFGDITHVLGAVHWSWLSAALGLQVLSMLALSVLQQLLLRAGGVAVELRRMVPVTLGSNAVAQSLPAGVVVAEGYAFRQYRRLGASPPLAGWVEAGAGALAAAALSAVGLLGALMAGGRTGELLLGPLTVVFVGAGATAVLFRRTRLLGALVRALLGRVETVVPRRVSRRLRRAERATEEMGDYTPTRRRWAAAGGLAVVNWSADAGTLMMALLATGSQVPWRGVFLAYAAGQLLSELPITPGGIGFVEGGLVVLLTRFGLSTAEAVAGALVYRAVSFWLLVAVGWLNVLGLRMRKRREADHHLPASMQSMSET